MFLLYSRRISATLLLVLLVAAIAHSQKRRLTQSEAVALAEQFIAQNGYTDSSPDKTKLSYETIEWQGNVDRMLQERLPVVPTNLERLLGFLSPRSLSCC